MKKKIKIEKGIPITRCNRGNRSPEADALIKMEVGDSFVMKDAKKIYSCARYFGIAIKTRRFFEADSKKWKFRIWKVGTLEK